MGSDCFRLYRRFERTSPKSYGPEYHPEKNTHSDPDIPREGKLIATMKLDRKKGKIIIERVVE
jgi:hypothetical protein